MAAARAFANACQSGDYNETIQAMELLDGIYSKSNRAITHYLNVHILSKCSRLNFFRLIGFPQPFKEAVKQRKSLLSIHRIVEIRLGSLEVVVKCEL